MQIHDVEQGTEEWLAVRAGLPTASKADSMVTAAKLQPSKSIETYARELAAEVLMGGFLPDDERFTGNKFTDRGHRLEPEARSLYGLSVIDPVAEVGFITNHGAGCSPDSLVGDTGLLEVKSPIAPNWIELAAVIGKDQFPAKYKLQCQFQLWVTERDWCDLVVYHPHDNFGMRSIRACRDESAIAALSKATALVIERRDELVSMIREAA